MTNVNVTTLTGLNIQPNNNEGPHVLSISSLTAEQFVALDPTEVRNGSVYYDIPNNQYWARQTYVTAANSATTSGWVPLISIPSMTAAQGAFYEATNATQGQMYGRSDTNIIRIYKGDAWVTITTA